MKSGSILSLLTVLGFLASGIGLSPLALQAQDKKASLEKTVFSAAAIKWNQDTQLPRDIKMDASVSVNEDNFFRSLRETFELTDHLEFVPEKENTGPQGDRHIRYTQQYKGIELARTQYIVHLKEGRVTHAHGTLPGEPTVDLLPSLNKEEAFRYACSHLGLSTHEAINNNVMMSRLSLQKESGKENGKLLLSRGIMHTKSEQ